MSRALYPVFLDLAGLPVVVVGGGAIAAAKIDGLLAAGARVTVIAPEICDAIRAQSSQSWDRPSAPNDSAVFPIDSCQSWDRPFRPSDLDGARYVVAAATPDVNREVAKAAAERGLFVNAVDDVASATAYLGGVVRKGEVTIAISTGGLAPALAGLLREAIEAVLPDDLDRWIDVAKRARLEWKAAKVPMAERRPMLLRALERIYA